MLLEANLATATLVAERIRARVAEQDVGEGHLTLRSVWPSIRTAAIRPRS